MKPYIPLLMVLMLLSASFVGISYRVEKSSTLSSDSNTLYVGGSGEGNYTKIQDAIDNASNGYTIFVYNGTYYEHLVINVSINLIGEDKNTTVIDGEWGGTVVSIYADFVTISGFKIIRSGGGGGKYYYGIFTSGRNTIITGNIFSNNHYDVNFESENCLFKDNILTGASVGIIIASNNTLIEGNYINESEIGILGTGYFYDPIYDYNNSIINNTIILCDTGIYLWGNIRTKIVGNIIKNNLEGIKLWSCDRCIISDNLVSNNHAYGIFLYLSGLNQIKNNNFIGNFPNAFFYSAYYPPNPIFNLWFRNYWDRPRLLPKPIFGFIVLFTLAVVIITIPWIQFDMLPAKEPYDI